MSHDDWITASLPKVDGTWNLHNALADQPLDFFFMSSSTVTIVNQPGQGNYNAANTFLEAFCQYRYSLGLPASVLNICPIDDVGFVAENPKNLKAQGLYFLQETDFLEYLELSLLGSQSPASTTPGRSSSQPPSVVASWENVGQIGTPLGRSSGRPEQSHPLASRLSNGYLPLHQNTNTVDHSN